MEGKCLLTDQLQQILIGLEYQFKSIKKSLITTILIISCYFNPTCSFADSPDDETIVWPDPPQLDISLCPEWPADSNNPSKDDIKKFTYRLEHFNIAVLEPFRRQSEKWRKKIEAIRIAVEDRRRRGIIKGHQYKTIIAQYRNLIKTTYDGYCMKVYKDAYAKYRKGRDLVEEIKQGIHAKPPKSEPRPESYPRVPSTPPPTTKSWVLESVEKFANIELAILGQGTLGVIILVALGIRKIKKPEQKSLGPITPKTVSPSPIDIHIVNNIFNVNAPGHNNTRR